MKKNTNHLFVSLSEQTMQELVTIVDETIAYELNRQPRKFTAAELWNIQRQKRSLSRRAGL